MLILLESLQLRVLRRHLLPKLPLRVRVLRVGVALRRSALPFEVLSVVLESLEALLLLGVGVLERRVERLEVLDALLESRDLLLGLKVRTNQLSESCVVR